MSQNAPGYCGSHNSDVFVPAVYHWISVWSGNEVDLCESCCAHWRANAVADPTLGASRITLLANPISGPSPARR
jgi:hypothetical protein